MRRAAVLVALAAAAGALLLLTLRDAPGPGPETIRESLRRLAEDPPEDSLMLGVAKRVARLRASAEPADPLQRAERLRLLSVELLRLGETEEAVRRAEELEALLAGELAGKAPEAFVEQAARERAVAYLRLGEQQNCVAHHNADSCLAPITGDGVHTDQRGSRAAIAEYRAILARRPDDLAARWLLNLALMTVGEWPEGAPEALRMPPASFASDYPLPRFRDIAPDLGLAVSSLAGGVVADDLDGDGYLDLMVSSYGPRDPVRFFRNERDGTFSERTRQAGLSDVTGGFNLAHADYDNDGDADVLVLRGAWLDAAGKIPSSLLENLGDGRFEDVTVRAGLYSPRPTLAAAWGDYDGDGLLDLYVGHETTDSGDPHPCELFRNRGDGTFEEVAAAAGVAAVGQIKGVAWGDPDEDGRPDLYVTRMDGPNLFFANAGKEEDGAVVFHEVAASLDVEEPVHAFATWFWDFDNDGDQDLYVSGYQLDDEATDHVVADRLGLPTAGERPRLYRNDGEGGFSDATRETGLYQVMLPMAANFGDLDGDGWPDFYLGTGAPDYWALVPNRMFRNDRGRRFQDVTTAGGFGHVQKGHGIAFADLDNDGDQDVFEVMGGFYSGDRFQNALYENPGSGSAWVSLDLEGTRSNRSAIGARVAVRVAAPSGARAIYTTVSSGGSFGASALRRTIGLGDATAIETVEIRWPSGLVETLRGLEMRRFYRAREAEGAAAPLDLRRIDLRKSPAEAAAHDHAAHEAARAP